MKVKSVSGITCYVRDLKKTVKFYQTLGFQVRKSDPSHATVYMNWFWIDFVAASKETRAAYKKEARLGGKGAGEYTYLTVEDVDAFHKYVRSKGLRPATQPADQPSGNREFVMRDPDGYKLVIFKRK